MQGSPADSQSPQPKPMVYWVQWVSLLNAIAIYVIVALLVGSQVESSRELRIVPWILGAVSVVLLALVFILRGAFARKTQYGVYLILRWALAEAPAVFGLVLVFLGFPWSIVGVFFAAAFLVLLLLAPTASRQAEYRELRGESSIIS